MFCRAGLPAVLCRPARLFLGRWMFVRFFWFLIDYLVCESIDMGVPKVEIDGDKVSYELAEEMFAAASFFWSVGEERDGCRLESDDMVTGTLYCSDSLGVAFSLGYFACAQVKAEISVEVDRRELDKLEAAGSESVASCDDVELELFPADDEPAPFVFD